MFSTWTTSGALGDLRRVWLRRDDRRIDRMPSVLLAEVDDRLTLGRKKAERPFDDSTLASPVARASKRSAQGMIGDHRAAQAHELRV